MRLLGIAIFVALPEFLAAQESGTALSVQVGRDLKGQNVVSFRTTHSNEQGDIVAAFVFTSPKGFLGPSNNPSDQSGFSNAEKTLFGVNYQPVTKTSFVHLFSKTKAGDLLYMSDINPRVAGLLPKPWSEAAQEFLRIESISGQRVNLQTVDFSGSSKQRFEFSVSVSSDGSITLSR